MSKLLKISGIALAVFAVSWSLTEAQAGGRRRARYCQPSYLAPVTTYSATAAADGRQRYQSAYQAPNGAVQNYYYHNTPSPSYRSGESLWDKQINDARKIKGL